MDFSKFDSMMDVAGLKADIEAAATNTSDNEDVPTGEYEVRVEKMELTESKSSGNPMVSVWWKVVAGNQQGRCIFQNQIVTKGFQLHIVNEMLRDMEVETPIDFESYAQYGKMLEDIYEEVKSTKTFHLDYCENKKGYKEFKIKEVFKV